MLLPPLPRPRYPSFSPCSAIPSKGKELINALVVFTVSLASLETGDDDASFTGSPEKVRLASQSAAAMMLGWQV